MQSHVFSICVVDETKLGVLLGIEVMEETYRYSTLENLQDMAIVIHLFAMRIGITSIEFDIKPLI